MLKNGHSHKGKQKFKCQDCGGQFIQQLAKKVIDRCHTGTD